MISAQDARLQTDDLYSESVEDELKSIEKIIERAIRVGEYSCSVCGCITHKARRRLEELGYVVKYGNQYNESYTYIQWR